MECKNMHHSIEEQMFQWYWHRNQVCNSALSYTITTVYAMSYKEHMKEKQQKKQETQGA